MPALRCTTILKSGIPCSAPAQASGKCFAHDPDTAAAWAGAQGKGRAKRRQNDATVAGFYELQGLRSYDDSLALLGRVMFEALASDPSPTRHRILIALARESTRIIALAEGGEAVARLQRVLRRPDPTIVDPLPEADDAPDS